MRFIDKTPIDDDDILNFLENRLFKDPSNRAQWKASVLRQYATYRASAGNPHITSPLNPPNSISDEFKKAYKNKWKKADFIEEIRNNLSINQCPFCGNMGSHEVDHFLPQCDYSELSIFSANLVPICECNSIKNDYYKSPNTTERFLHPYYDVILKERLILLKISGISATNDTPSFNIEVALLQSHQLYSQVAYQVKTLVLREKFLNFMGNLWSQLIQIPETQLFEHWKKNTNMSVDQLKNALKIAIRHYDAHHSTKNNWHSIFYYGILNEPVALNHIYQKIL